MLKSATQHTLFLDRDGVINREREKDYVKKWSEFEFEEGVFEALQMLQKYFSRLLIVTNQRGVGAGLMHQSDLDDIHHRMQDEFKKQGIIISKIYSATDEDRNSIKRKPHPYMGLCAKEDFPDINFSDSFIAGNTASDMAFGKGLGLKTVYIDDKKLITDVTEILNADFEADSLLIFAQKIDQGLIKL